MQHKGMITIQTSQRKGGENNRGLQKDKQSQEAWTWFQ